MYNISVRTKASVSFFSFSQSRSLFKTNLFSSQRQNQLSKNFEGTFGFSCKNFPAQWVHLQRIFFSYDSGFSVRCFHSFNKLISCVGRMTMFLLFV